MGGGQGPTWQASPTQGNFIFANGDSRTRGETGAERELQDAAGGGERGEDKQARHEQREVQAVQGRQVRHKGGKVSGEDLMMGWEKLLLVVTRKFIVMCFFVFVHNVFAFVMFCKIFQVKFFPKVKEIKTSLINA